MCLSLHVKEFFNGKNEHLKKVLFHCFNLKSGFLNAALRSKQIIYSNCIIIVIKNLFCSPFQSCPL
jgi:hypothetical protein